MQRPLTDSLSDDATGQGGGEDSSCGKVHLTPPLIKHVPLSQPGHGSGGAWDSEASGSGQERTQGDSPDNPQGLVITLMVF